MSSPCKTCGHGASWHTTPKIKNGGRRPCFACPRRERDCADYQSDNPPRRRAKESVATLGERERCAKLVEDFALRPTGHTSVLFESDFYKTREYICKELASEIRGAVKELIYCTTQRVYRRGRNERKAAND